VKLLSFKSLMAGAERGLGRSFTIQVLALAFPSVRFVSSHSSSERLSISTELNRHKPAKFIKLRFSQPKVVNLDLK
jgi:hypothetical protein